MASFYDITVFFSENTKLIERGENHLKSSHLQSFLFDAENEDIRGKVQASLRDTIYSVWIHFKDGKIDKAHCTCPNGNFRCSQMATVLLHSVNNCSSTDRPCVWNKSVPVDKNTMDNIFVSNKFVALKRKPDITDKEFLFSSLASDSYTGLYWLLSPEPRKNADCAVITFDDLIHLSENECENLKGKQSFIIENLTLTDINIQEVFNATIGQRRNYLWGEFRKGRITASNFGLVLRALKREQYPPSLFKTLQGEYYIEKVKAVEWGIVHERNARSLYQEVTKLKILNSGLYLHESGILGCSPDGVVGNKIIEIKCTFTKIDTDLIKAIHEGKWFIKFNTTTMNAELRENDGIKVYLFEDNALVFNMKSAQGHSYYHQVQGMLHIMDKQSCDFIIWSPTMTIIFNIKKDPSSIQNIDRLISFYKNIFIYYLL